MNILFIHGNYPGQFKGIAANLAAQGHRVIYLSHPATGTSWHLPGVSVRRFAPHREPNPSIHPYLGCNWAYLVFPDGPTAKMTQKGL